MKIYNYINLIRNDIYYYIHERYVSNNNNELHITLTINTIKTYNVISRNCSYNFI